MKRQGAIAINCKHAERMESTRGVLRGALLSLIMAGVIAASAMVSIMTPLSPVPVTLQVGAVLLAGLLLGPRWGALSVCWYIAAGLLGAPVFAMGVGGPAILAQPSFGYILGFPAAAWMVGTLVSRPGAGFGHGLIASLTGVAVIYLFGFSWLIGYMSMSGTSGGNIFMNAWAMGVAPFIMVDSLKALLAAGLWGSGRFIADARR